MDLSGTCWSFGANQLAYKQSNFFKQALWDTIEIIVILEGFPNAC